MFVSYFHLYVDFLVHTHHHPPFPRFFRFLPTRDSPLKNVTAAILSCVVLYLHEGTGKLRKTWANTVDRLTESGAWKMTTSSSFRCAGHGPTVTHPSTDPARSCMSLGDLWCRLHLSIYSETFLLFGIIITRNKFSKYIEYLSYFYPNSLTSSISTVNVRAIHL